MRSKGGIWGMFELDKLWECHGCLYAIEDRVVICVLFFSPHFFNFYFFILSKNNKDFSKGII